MKAAMYLFLSMQSHQMLVCAAYFLSVIEHLHQEGSRLKVLQSKYDSGKRTETK